MQMIKKILPVLLIFIVSNTSSEAGSQYHKSIGFYGHEVNIIHHPALATVKLQTLDFDYIEKVLDRLRNSELQNTTNLLRRHQDFYDLDAIGMVLLTEKTVSQLLAHRGTNEKTLIKYLLLKKLGYDVLLTRASNRLFVMGYLDFNPVNFVYIPFDGKRYIDLNFKNSNPGGNHDIYADTYKTYKVLHRDFKNKPNLNARKNRKTIQFNYNFETYKVEALSNQSLLDFQADLPMLEIGKEYVEMGVSKEMDASLIAALKYQVQGMEREDQIKFLLAFVQQVVPYGSDYAKYGTERFYYPEETIMSVNADCEDKAFLMAYLCKELLNVKTLGLFFKKDQHINIAIHMPEFNNGYSFKYEGETYVTCEPTARNHRLGFSEFGLDRVHRAYEMW